jgi:hypothetical protein
MAVTLQGTEVTATGKANEGFWEDMGPTWDLEGWVEFHGRRVGGTFQEGPGAGWSKVGFGVATGQAGWAEGNMTRLSPAWGLN